MMIQLSKRKKNQLTKEKSDLCSPSGLKMSKLIQDKEGK